MKFPLLTLCAVLLVACARDDDSPDSPPQEYGNGARSDVPAWSIQYQGAIQRRKKDYHVVDLFDVSAADLRALKADGTRPIAYFSSQYEKWRSDAGKFPAKDLGKNLDNWPGERWVNPNSTAVRQIMRERMRLAKQRGFYGVDVDNVDFYHFNTGFDNSQAKAAEYIRFLAAEAHRNGLRYSLKNALELVPKLKHQVDFFQNEQGIQYNELDVYRGIGKPVFNIEYRKPRRGVPGIYTLYKPSQSMDGREEVILP